MLENTVLLLAIAVAVLCIVTGITLFNVKNMAATIKILVNNDLDYIKSEAKLIELIGKSQDRIKKLEKRIEYK